MLLAAFHTSTAAAQTLPSSQILERRNFDARPTTTTEPPAPLQATQEARLVGLLNQVPDLSTSFEGSTGVMRTMYNRSGYMSGPQSGTPLEIARKYLSTHRELIGLTPEDIDGFEVRSISISSSTGANRVHLRQMAHGLPVYNGELQVNSNRDGRIMSMSNGFRRDLLASINTTLPALTAGEAVDLAAEQISVPVDSDAASTAHLMLLPIDTGQVRLVWNFQFETPDQAHYLDFNVDAVTGKVWTRFDWVSPGGKGRGRGRGRRARAMSKSAETPTPEADPAASAADPGSTPAVSAPPQDFSVVGSGAEAAEGKVAPPSSIRAYELPAESPHHTEPVPPADGRVLIADPSDPVASPLGWHDTGTTSFTIMRGNNVHAYEDSSRSGTPPSVEPDCGADLNCDFPVNLEAEPSTYRDAAVANLFYWNNKIHDIQYQYGFDEAAGNFQVNNFSSGGFEGDDVRAEAQDGGSNCNANFLTPTDGLRPRMQMFICSNTSPARDGDFDNGVIVHEYAHGISNRTVGGPLNVNCLNNSQQMGEGISDILALMYTAEAGDAGPDPRTIGTYLVGQSVAGGGIRPAPYSTDSVVNGVTYSDIGTQAVPHGIGFVWATIAWEAYWELVDHHGFDPDLYNALGGSGNQRMMIYVQEGMANTACSPTFLDARDGIIQAAIDNFGGEDVCRLWDAFARRGLGVNASTLGPNTQLATNGFEIPVACQCSPQPAANAGSDQSVCTSESATIGTPAVEDNSYEWSPGGETTAQITVTPSVDTAYTVTATTLECGSKTDSVTVFVTQAGQEFGLVEDFETGAPDWTTSGLWHLADSSLCGSPAPTTQPTAMYYGQNSSCNYSTNAATAGSLTSRVIAGIDSTSVLTFNYWREVENFTGAFDKAEVNVIHVGDSARTNVFTRTSSNPSLSAWTSSGEISLAAFEGSPIQIEFSFNSLDSLSNTFTGWFVDDVEVTSSLVCEICVDDDDDGVCDAVDNCVDIANPIQVDSNHDGLGNLCDPDLDDDGVVGIPDFNLFRAAFGSVCGSPGYDSATDFDSNCAVGIPDFNVFRTFFGGSPGPSGLSCAGISVPCP